MSNPPSSPRSAVLAWAQTHVQPWIDGDSQIGLTEPQALAFQTKYNACIAAINAQDAAKSAAEVATMAAQNAYRDMKRSLSDTVRLIRAYAVNRPTPEAQELVYQLAQIPAPATPTPLPAPGTPFDITVAIAPTTGALTLAWKCVNPPGAQGTTYLVRRRTGGTGDFAFVGATGIKKFTDSNFTAGPDSVQYTIQAQRSDSAGTVSNILTVNFGKTAGGQQTVSAVEDATPMKLAA